MLPHFGRLDLLQDMVRSVVAQNDPHWRLTVVDDSGEAGVGRVQQWCASISDSRIRYIRNPVNLGINRNFQKCVSLVEHELAVIVGTDDLMLPNYIESVRQAHFWEPSAAMIQPGVEVIDENGKPMRSLIDMSKRWIYAPRVSGRTVLAGEDLAVSLLRGNWLYFPALCWRAEPLRRTGFRDGLSVVLDLALVLDLVEDGESLLFEPAKCFQYRRHRSSLSSMQAADGRRFAEEHRFFLQVAERMAQRRWHRAAKASRSHVSSRINALMRIPAALRQRRGDGVRALTRHVLGRAPSAVD